ncbi:CTP synthetase [Profundibacter amoris]|uniref:CTP synthetase n=1 Tax=Profundibacter amoris TaxID=2171755 RepID=A0A347UIQ2_9RHOB|nr:CTP synthetase [Profundibacter amoris]AXX98730.1 CTP synthetase [Profundibacter amoris]
MLRLTLLLYSFISATLAGILIVVVLAAGYGTTMPIIYAAIVGFVVAFPVSWIVAKKISAMR